MKTKFRNFKLRMMLFRIWFVKNIFLWLQILGVVLLIATLTGAITESTPVLGTLVYPIFSPLIDTVSEMIREKQITNFVNVVRILMMFLYSIGIFVVKVKTLAREDIKSRKQKIAIIQANLYFDEDNRLRKKSNTPEKELELPTSDDSPKLNTGLISGTINAVRELGIIMTADFSGDEEEAKAEYKRVIEETESQDAAEIAESLHENTMEIMEEVALEELEKVQNDETLTEKEKKERFNIFKWIFHLFKKKDKETEEKEEENTEESDDNVVIDNDVEIDINDEQEPEVETKEEVKEEIQETPKEEKPVISLNTNTVKTSSSTSTADAFIARLKSK